MITNDLETILHHVGIDPTDHPLEIISQLMNCTLQCLGGIRLLFELLEKEKLSNYLSANYEANRFLDKGREYWAMKKAFQHGASRMMHEIMKSEEIHNLNPSRHIVESFPNGQTFGQPGWLAAHWTVLGMVDYDFINIKGLDIQTKKKFSTEGGLNLEHENNSVETQIDILQHLPSTCFAERDKENRSVLHIAARLESVPLFEATLQACHRHRGCSIRDSNSNGALPLHNAARFSPSLTLFERVEAEFPEALLIVNKEGMLPVHWAAAKSRSVAIIQHLLEAYPASIHIANAEGYLPLHLAGQNDCLAVVEKIYESYPEAIQIPDQDGGLPFHHACSITKNLAVVQFLYDQYPAAVYHTQEHEITPLHLAASQNDYPDLFRFLLMTSPESREVKDAVGCIPLDCFLMRLKYGVTRSMIDSLKVFFVFFSEQNDQKSEVDVERGFLSEIVQRDDYLSRLLLQHLANPMDSKLRNLLRQARQLPILLCVQLSRVKQLEFSRDQKSSPSRVSVNGVVLRRIEAAEVVLLRLCQRFMSPEEREIPAGILRIIIRFL